MKEILKNKWMIGFMLVVLSVSYVNGSNEKKLIEEYERETKNEVVYKIN